MRSYSLRVVAAVLILFPFLSANAITRNWVGSVSSNWSEPNNWSPAGVPTAADSLVFPAAGSNTKNDLPAGTAFGPIHFSGGNNTLSGNQLVLTGNLDFDPSAQTFFCHADVKVGAPIMIAATSNNIYYGALDVNGQTLLLGGYNTTLVALNGSGTVNVSGYGININGGNFSGTINGAPSSSVDVIASLPNANITGLIVSGNGTVGNVTAVKLWPGHMSTAGLTDFHYFGTLNTKDLSISYEYRVDLSSSSNDSAVVTGSVSIAGSLVVNLPSTIPSAGQAFTIIANDGNDPVSGTFTGLPEGAIVNAAAGGDPFFSVPFKISYHGGDGNDVVLTTQLTTKHWIGGPGANWSNAANWIPQAAPVAGEPLMFGGSSTMVNDLPSGFSAGPLTVSTAPLTLTGNPLTLTGNVTFNVDLNYYAAFNCSVPLKIGAALTISSTMIVSDDAIDVNGQTLTINNSRSFDVKALNGSGTVNASGLGVQLDNDGSFSGTLTGTWNVLGSLPNAAVNATTLTGTGTVGNVVVSNLRPGSNAPGAADPHTISGLHTKSLTITQQYSVDLSPGSTDATFVTGTVTLTGASLAVSLQGDYPPVGVPMTIISNDGSDAVVGTFAGLPEGATIALNNTVLSISYHGGDGNDVTLTPISTLKSWVSLYDGRWSLASNWSPQAPPAAGEPLQFPGTVPPMSNDLPAGSSVGALTFKGGNVQLYGNLLTLTGNVTFEPSVSSFVCNAPLKIGNALTLGAAPAAVYYAIDVNGQTLTINTTAVNSPTTLGVLTGGGTVNLNGPGAQILRSGAFSGVLHGSIDLLGVSLPDAGVIAPILTGGGTLGNVTVTTLRPGTGDPSGPDLHRADVIQTKSLTLAGGSFDVDLGRNVLGEFDLMQVTGTVSLSGALNVTLTGPAPIFGQSFVIIDNDGTDKVNGTFTNLPEGAAVHSGNTLFRISYMGGDGNDVELTTAEQPVITVTQPKSSTVIGEKTTFTASFAAGLPSPFGILTFAVDGLPIGTAPITNGSATIDVSNLAIGDRAITASWAGATAFLAAVSAPLTHTVRRGDTSTTLVAVDPLVYGSSRFAVTAAVTAPAVTPMAGSVTLRENGLVVGTATLDGNAATIAAPSLHPGLHLLIASFDGSSTLFASESRPLTVTVARAETRLAVSHEETTAGSITLTVAASPANEVPEVPTGTVTISENGNPIAVEPINGTARIPLTLTPGAHLLTVTYSGDANFLADAAQFAVGGAPSRHRGVRH